jgi:hypothetical protein
LKEDLTFIVFPIWILLFEFLFEFFKDNIFKENNVNTVNLSLITSYFVILVFTILIKILHVEQTIEQNPIFRFIIIFMVVLKSSYMVVKSLDHPTNKNNIK